MLPSCHRDVEKLIFCKIARQCLPRPVCHDKRGEGLIFVHRVRRNALCVRTALRALIFALSLCLFFALSLYYYSQCLPIAFAFPRTDVRYDMIICALIKLIICAYDLCCAGSSNFFVKAG